MMNDNIQQDYAPVLARLIPDFKAKFMTPIYDLPAFLESHYGQPERSTAGEGMIQLAFRKEGAGINLFLNLTGQIIGVSSLAFTYPLWKPCPQSRWSGLWVVGTGTSSYIPLFGSITATIANAAAIALADYYIQAANLKPTLCAGLCTDPCWCATNTQLPSRNTVITTNKLWGIPVRINVTITFSGWATAFCEGWAF